MGRYIARVHISDDWFVNFADGSARLELAVGAVYRYGLRSGDSGMMSLAAETARSRGAYRCSCRELFRELHTMADWHDMLAFVSTEPEPEVFIGGINVMVARERMDGGFFVAAKAGHNAESHNHNDVGQFIIFLDGQPALVDAGVETYTRKTFSPDRYSIWTMRSDWHNLPTIGGITQSAGIEYAARDVKYDYFPSLSMDIAGAYPQEAGVISWKRTVALDREKGEALIDDCWVLEHPQSVDLHLVTASKPHIEDGRFTLSVVESGVEVSIPDGCKVNVDEKAIDDRRLSPVWGERLWRVNLVFPPAKAGRWTLHVRRMPVVTGNLDKEK